MFLKVIINGFTDHPIIHRDIKASNILLTETLRAKVADFGFARLGPEDPDATHISTQIKGTAGYVDPEYLRTYQLTEKSDVYSFGVLLVELVTGRHPIERHRDLKDRFTTRWVNSNPLQSSRNLASMHNAHCFKCFLSRRRCRNSNKGIQCWRWIQG